MIRLGSPSLHTLALTYSRADAGVVHGRPSAGHVPLGEDLHVRTVGRHAVECKIARIGHMNKDGLGCELVLRERGEGGHVHRPMSTFLTGPALRRNLWDRPLTVHAVPTGSWIVPLFLPLCMMGGRPQKLRSDVFNQNESGHGSAAASVLCLLLRRCGAIPRFTESARRVW